MSRSVEEVDRENVKDLTDGELRDLRHRAAQVYDRAEAGRELIRKRAVGVRQPVPRDRWLDSYRVIRDEMDRRGLAHDRSALDGKLVRKDLRGIDVGELPIIVLREGAVCLTGQFVTDPKRTATVGIWLGSGDFPAELEKRMVEAVLAQTDRDAAIVDDLEAPAIPAYDLCLVPRDETRDTADVLRFVKDEEVDVEKPYANEHAARQLDPGQFRKFARQNNKFGRGIHAIWGVLPNGKTKLQSVRFSSKLFTVAEARAWLKEHGMKTGIEPASGAKKAEVGKFCKVDEAERIVGGIVYAPDEVDSQGDYTDDREIWSAIKHYMIKTGGVMKIMHKGKEIDAPVVEVFQAEEETAKGGSVIPKGAWYQSNYVPDDDTWKAILSGELTGFSMAGRAEIDED